MPKISTKSMDEVAFAKALRRIGATEEKRPLLGGRRFSLRLDAQTSATVTGAYVGALLNPVFSPELTIRHLQMKALELGAQKKTERAAARKARKAPAPEPAQLSLAS